MSRKARDMGTRVWWNSTHPNILLLRGADLGHPPGGVTSPAVRPFVFTSLLHSVHPIPSVACLE